MADKTISSSNHASKPISSSSELFDVTAEKTCNDGPPAPTLRSKESEQKILNRQQANKSVLAQTQPDFIAAPSRRTFTTVEPAKTVSTGASLPPLTVFVKFIHDGRAVTGVFENVSDISQLFSDMKQRYGIEEELSLLGVGKRINDMSQLRAAWESCEGMFHVVSSKKS
ncbi:hypothetical protein [Noviherbaspirillum suwonense]|uniref:hypothetical protein n=1 Tax=Noviherbaspirillum suwonense TaxID=1224511 RepID=UPI0024B8352C|nr:hypothetical protein [Noviherbaspirillum suwonense]